MLNEIFTFCFKIIIKWNLEMAVVSVKMLEQLKQSWLS